MYADPKVVLRAQQFIDVNVETELARQAFRDDLDNLRAGRLAVSATKYAARLTTGYPMAARSVFALHRSTGGVPNVNFLDYAQFVIDMSGSAPEIAE